MAEQTRNAGGGFGVALALAWADLVIEQAAGFELPLAGTRQRQLRVSAERELLLLANEP